MSDAARILRALAEPTPELIDAVAIGIRGGSGTIAWDALDDRYKAMWRGDAKRALAALHASLPGAIGE